MFVEYEEMSALFFSPVLILLLNYSADCIVPTNLRCIFLPFNSVIYSE